MKRIILFITILAGVCCAAFSALQLQKKNTLVNKIKTQEQEVRDELNNADAVFASLPVAKYGTNTELIESFLNTDILKMKSITAQSKNSMGDYEDIISVKDTGEVAYFTNTVSRIAITASYNDMGNVFKYITSTDVPFSKVNFDIANKTVTVYVTPITVGMSDVSSEFTADAEGTATQQPEEAKPVDNTTQSGTEGFDIQYLGGE